VLITPHASGHSPHSGRRMFDLLRENLRRFDAGEPLLNVVDKQVGS
jgi:phosphoglycerate dehydrogenase-like enzyme